MTWLLKLVLPREDRDAVLGDLIEERARQNNPDHWYRRQVLRSIGSIMWANIRRGVWLKTFGAALAGYAVVVVLVIATSSVALLLGFFPSEQAYTLASLVVGFGAALAAGYLTAWLRPGATTVLAAIVVLMGVVSLIVTGDQAPLWYQLALIVIGPIAALAGGKLRAVQGRRA